MKTYPLRTFVHRILLIRLGIAMVHREVLIADSQEYARGCRMSRTKKIAFFLALALVFVLIAVSALVLLLPRLIDLESVKTKG